MDPFLHLISTTQRNMLDNNQRSSEQLREQLKKESASRKTRAGDVDVASFSTDVGDMGGDSLDPDLHGGPEQDFMRHWEEEPEKEGSQQEEEEPEDEEEGEAGEDAFEQEQKLPAHLVVQDETQVQEYDSGKWENYEPPVEEPQEDPEEKAQEASPKRSGLRLSFDSYLRESQEESQDEGENEKVSLTPETGKEVASTQESPSDSQESTWSSLLDHSQGFLVTEPTLAQELEEVSLTASVEEVPQEIKVWTKELIVGQASERIRQLLEVKLARFGAGILRYCVGQGVRVRVLPRGMTLLDHPEVLKVAGKDSQVEDACYLPALKECIVTSTAVTKVHRYFQPVTFYFAVALDHVLGDENYASVRSHAVVANFHKNLSENSFSDDFTSESVVHYFAQAVEAYLGVYDCIEPVWNKEDLYDFDETMYEYIEYLFKKYNGASW